MVNFNDDKHCVKSFMNFQYYITLVYEEMEEAVFVVSC